MARGSRSVPVPHRRASAERSRRRELQVNAVDASATPSGISTCRSNLRGDETWKRGPWGGNTVLFIIASCKGTAAASKLV